jgi:flagellar hook-associated protein FlgK
MAGLNIAQAGILSTSQNVAGTTVEGYSRRNANVIMDSLAPNSLMHNGSSFAVEGFTRHYSSLIGGQLLTQQSKSSYTDTLVQYTNSIDGLVADKSTGLNTAISKFFNAMGAYAADPTNKALAGAITGTAKEVEQRMIGMSTLVTQIQSDARSALTDTVAQVNTILPALAGINQKIVDGNSPGVSAPSADLLDERDRIVAKLQDLVGGSTLINQDGTASYLVSGQHLVDREIANSFANDTGTTPIRTDILLTGLRLKVASQDPRNPVLVPIVLNAVQQLASNGTPLLDANGNSLMLPGQSVLQDGKAGAYLHLIQNFVPTVQKSIDLLAAQLVRQVNTAVSATNGAIAPIFGFKSTSAGGAPLTSGALLDGLFKPSGTGADSTYSEIVEAANPNSRNYKTSVDTNLSRPE